MDSLLRLLLRLLVVPFGIAVGMVAALIVIMVGYWQLGDLLAGVPEVEFFALADALSAAAFVMTAVVLVMWAVAAIGILFAEAFAVRSWIFHTLNGAVSAWIATQIFPPYPDTPVPFDGMLYVLGAGLAGGLAYWAVAGWNAGFWKPLGRPLAAVSPHDVSGSAPPRIPPHG
ncbi:hypothetical protein [Ancylobacter radicis]|uniref:Uncharacterized protein n=1 Tax=Ancylobacter radicis TaxID=2836179 RepID=A0ABS5R2Q1_9HYPH|nr:hypothetical protein [Ancylobacter radicis]MBS9475939.1 hypothetical protein [Ancylobacter radicis]